MSVFERSIESELVRLDLAILEGLERFLLEKSSLIRIFESLLEERILEG